MHYITTPDLKLSTFDTHYSYNIFAYNIIGDIFELLGHTVACENSYRVQDHDQL